MIRYKDKHSSHAEGMSYGIYDTGRERAEQPLWNDRQGQNAAGQILDASNRETLTMLVQDGKDNIDEKKQIQKILKDNKLINEDLKGIEIDFNF